MRVVAIARRERARVKLKFTLVAAQLGAMYESGRRQVPLERFGAKPTACGLERPVSGFQIQGQALSIDTTILGGQAHISLKDGNVRFQIRLGRVRGDRIVPVGSPDVPCRAYLIIRVPSRRIR